VSYSTSEEERYITISLFVHYLSFLLSLVGFCFLLLLVFRLLFPFSLTFSSSFFLRLLSLLRVSTPFFFQFESAMGTFMDSRHAGTLLGRVISAGQAGQELFFDRDPDAFAV
jgi:hypothetical protein